MYNASTFWYLIKYLIIIRSKVKKMLRTAHKKVFNDLAISLTRYCQRNSKQASENTKKKTKQRNNFPNHRTRTSIFSKSIHKLSKRNISFRDKTTYPLKTITMPPRKDIYITYQMWKILFNILSQIHLYFHDLSLLFSMEIKIIQFVWEFFYLLENL